MFQSYSLLLPFIASLIQVSVAFIHSLCRFRDTARGPRASHPHHGGPAAPSARQGRATALLVQAGVCLPPGGPASPSPRPRGYQPGRQVGPVWRDVAGRGPPAAAVPATEFRRPPLHRGPRRVLFSLFPPPAAWPRRVHVQDAGPAARGSLAGGLRYDIIFWRCVLYFLHSNYDAFDCDSALAFLA